MKGNDLKIVVVTLPALTKLMMSPMKSTKSLPIIIIDNILPPLDLIVKRDQFSNAEILSIVTGHECI